MPTHSPTQKLETPYEGAHSRHRAAPRLPHNPQGLHLHPEAQASWDLPASHSHRHSALVCVTTHSAWVPPQIHSCPLSPLPAPQSEGPFRNLHWLPTLLPRSLALCSKSHQLPGCFSHTTTHRHLRPLQPHWGHPHLHLPLLPLKTKVWPPHLMQHLPLAAPQTLPPTTFCSPR